jgi:TonB family protein
MTIRLASAFVIGTLAMGAVLAARPQVPDFAGTWRLDPARRIVTGGPERVDQYGRGGSTVTPPVKLRNVPPRYPDDALRSRIEGLVIIEAVIDQRGDVVDAQVLRSVPPLDRAALEAVRQWRFKPATRDGQPIPVAMAVTVTFNVSGPGGPMSSARLPPGAGGTGRGTGPGLAQPAELTITQKVDELVVTRETGIGREKLTYRLDGKVVKNRQLGRGGGAPGEYQFESRWDGAKVVSIITGPSDDRRSTRTETRYLDGDTMVVETVRPAPAGAPDWFVKEVYTRVR